MKSNQKEGNRKNIEYLTTIGSRAKAIIHTKLLSPFFHKIGKNSRIIPPFRYLNMKNIKLGNNIVIHRNCWIQVLTMSVENKSPIIIIKDNSHIGMDATISAAKKIVIEEDVVLARNVFITDHEHEYADIEKPIIAQGIRKIAEVRIRADSWLGQNSVILPGVTIGRHCIIGANSVVNKDVPDYSIAVGAPARVIKAFSHKRDRWETL